MSLLSRSTRAAAVAVAVGGLVAALPAAASASATNSRHHGFAVNQVNLVSDVPGQAALTDPDLLNSWGFALGPTSPISVADNHADTATFYSLTPGSSRPTKTGRITFPSGTSPAGQTFNTTTGFVNTTAQGSAPAQFIFATESGQIAAYSPQVDAAAGAAEIRVTTPNAEYKGVAIAAAKAGTQLYASDFTQNRIDVFNSSFGRVAEPAWAFRDPFIPRGFGPFHIKVIQGNLFVAYAVVNRKTGDDVAGRGHGFVDEFSPEGRLVSRIASRGFLNSPWGMGVAPASWGPLAGALLVGNFGDGRINIILPDGHGGFRPGVVGQLRDNATGRPLVIDGLWGITGGTATTGGTDVMWFSSGPDDEAHGLIGVLRLP